MMEYPSTTATLHATSSKSLGSLGHSSTELRALSTGGGGNASGPTLGVVPGRRFGRQASLSKSYARMKPPAALPLFDMSVAVIDSLNLMRASMEEEFVLQSTLAVPAHQALACRIEAYGTPFGAPALQAAAEGQLTEADKVYAACLAAPPESDAIGNPTSEMSLHRMASLGALHRGHLGAHHGPHHGAALGHEDPMQQLQQRAQEAQHGGYQGGQAEAQQPAAQPQQVAPSQAQAQGQTASSQAQAQPQQAPQPAVAPSHAQAAQAQAPPTPQAQAPAAPSGGADVLQRRAGEQLLRCPSIPKRPDKKQDKDPQTGGGLRRDSLGASTVAEDTVSLWAEDPLGVVEDFEPWQAYAELPETVPAASLAPTAAVAVPPLPLPLHTPVESSFTAQPDGGDGAPVEAAAAARREPGRQRQQWQQIFEGCVDAVAALVGTGYLLLQAARFDQRAPAAVGQLSCGLKRLSISSNASTASAACAPILMEA